MNLIALHVAGFMHVYIHIASYVVSTVDYLCLISVPNLLLLNRQYNVIMTVVCA